MKRRTGYRPLAEPGVALHDRHREAFIDGFLLSKPHPALRATFPSKALRNAHRSTLPRVTRGRATPSPRSGEGGRRPDGVRKAGMVRRRFAVTVVQSDSGRSSGPHPIRRCAPPSPARWGRGPRRDLGCVNAVAPALTRERERRRLARRGWPRAPSRSAPAC